MAAGIEEFVANVNRHLDEILKNVTEKEQQEIEAARQQETAYFSKLENTRKTMILGSMREIILRKPDSSGLRMLKRSRRNMMSGWL